MPIGKNLLPEFDHEMATTRKVLERVPDDKLAWKPHEKSMSLGRLALHLAEIPHWAAEVLKSAEFDIMPPGAPPYQPKEARSRQEILAEFDKNAAEARAAIAGASDAEFAGNWSLLAGGRNIFTQPRAGVVRGMVMSHLIHHRGQLTVYYRLNGVPVPSIYGPSADESNM